MRFDVPISASVEPVIIICVWPIVSLSAVSYCWAIAIIANWPESRHQFAFKLIVFVSSEADDDDR